MIYMHVCVCIHECMHIHMHTHIKIVAQSYRLRTCVCTLGDNFPNTPSGTYIHTPCCYTYTLLITHTHTHTRKYPTLR